MMEWIRKQQTFPGYAAKRNLIGAILHNGQAALGKEIYGSFDFYKWKHGPNLTASVLLRVIETWCRFYKLPPILYLQLDNCMKKNKNQYLMWLLALLVELFVFNKVQCTLSLSSNDSLAGISNFNEEFESDSPASWHDDESESDDADEDYIEEASSSKEKKKGRRSTNAKQREILDQALIQAKRLNLKRRPRKFCTSHNDLPPLPCRSVCLDVFSHCNKYYDLAVIDWPAHLNCTLFPEPPQLCLKPPSSTPSSTTPNHLATNMLQFVFLSDSGFRFPIDQFPSGACIPTDLFFIFWDGVLKMRETGFKMYWCILDGAAVNRQFINLHFKDKD
ncbi:hypothetical protein ACROYT_G015160 [Oculina patagonica]